MQILNRFLILLLLLGICSCSGLKKNQSLDQSISKLATQISQEVKDSNSTLVVGDFVESTSNKKTKTSSTIETRLEEFMVQYAQKNGYKVVERKNLSQMVENSGNIQGIPIKTADYILSGTFSNQYGYYRVVAKLTNLKTSENKAVFSAYLPYGNSEVVEEYILTENTVFDTETGLTWQRYTPEGSHSVEEAESYCKNLVIEGANKWRFPTKDELFSLSSRPEKVKAKAFKGTDEDYYYWTSTECIDNYLGIKRKEICQVNIVLGKIDKVTPLFGKGKVLCVGQ